MSFEQKEKLIEFYEQVGERYLEQKIVYKTLRGVLRKKFVFARLQEFHGKILDVGCNQGMYLRHYSGGARFGLDLSYHVLKNIPDGEDIHLIVGDAERLFCFKGDSFDALLCSEVIEHCLDPQAVFEGIALVLREGGKALITTPNYRKKKTGWIDLGELEHYGVHSRCDDKYFHTAYRPEELVKLAQGADLSVLEVGTLEKEVKYATKFPVLLLFTGRLLNLIFKSKKFEKFIQRLFDWLSLFIFKCCAMLGMNKFLNRMVKEGVRSYIIVSKLEF